MNIKRATYDKKTIDAWAEKINIYRSKRGYWKNIFMLIFVFCCFSLIFINDSYIPYIIGFGFLNFVVGLYLQIEESLIFCCPNCGESPVGFADRRSPMDVDYCNNCFYWLKSPYSSDQVKKV